MTKHFEKSQPVIRNRACVIHTDLEITFLSKEQLELFTAEFLKDNEYPNFEIETAPGDSLELTKYTVSIYDTPWANNLTKIAKLLEKYDYNEGFND